MALADDLLAVLDDPTHMWAHALRELSRDAQRLFLTLVTLPKPVTADVLQVAYTSQTPQRSESFTDSLRSLEDSFVTIDRYYGDQRLVRFRNPSLQDFANVYISEHSDWFGELLSAPAYYEQVVIVINLAMAEESYIVDTRTRRRKSSSPKYLGIRNWAERHSSRLVKLAVSLLSSERAEYFITARKSRTAELIAVLQAYGVPTDPAIRKELLTAFREWLNPIGHDQATMVIDGLKDAQIRALLDSILDDRSLTGLRGNILDKDNWRYGILSKIDRLLELDSESSWDTWGQDYLDYARQLAHDLDNTTSYDDLTSAIDELNEVGDTLGLDLYDEIRGLKERRDNLPSTNDYDEIESSASATVEPDRDALKLHSIFESLL